MFSIYLICRSRYSSNKVNYKVNYKNNNTASVPLLRNDARQDEWRKTRNIVLDPLARKASGELEVLLDEAGVKRMADEGKLVSFLVGLNDGGYHHSTLFLPGLRCVSVVKTAPVNMHVNSVC